MAKYGQNADAIAALVREAEVHRDVYVDPEIFELEMEHLFRTAGSMSGTRASWESPAISSPPISAVSRCWRAATPTAPSTSSTTAVRTRA